MNQTARHEEMPNDAPTAAVPTHDAADMRGRWEHIQAGFVDDPQRAVAEANALVDAVVQRVTRSFEQQRASLEQKWAGGQEVSTEELRQALQTYRDFFNRLLHADPAANATFGR